MLHIHYTKTSALDTFEGFHDVAIVMPAIDIELAWKAAKVMQLRSDQEGMLIIALDDLQQGFIATTNALYERTRSTYFCYVAQDAFPGHYWLDYGVQTLQKSHAGLLAFNDGRFFGRIAVFGLANRKWIDTVYSGKFFYPGYHSHFADTEISVIAQAGGNLVFNPNALLIEVDYEKHLHGNLPADETLYRQRAAQGFDEKTTPFIPT